MRDQQKRKDKSMKDRTNRKKEKYIKKQSLPISFRAITNLLCLFPL